MDFRDLDLPLLSLLSVQHRNGRERRHQRRNEGVTATSAELDAPGALEVGDAESAAPSATDDNLISGKAELLPCLRHGQCTSSLFILPLSARRVEKPSLLLLLLLLMPLPLPLPLIMIMIEIILLVLMVVLVAVLHVCTEEASMPRRGCALSLSLRANTAFEPRFLTFSFSVALSPLCIGREDLRHSPCFFLTPLVYHDRGLRGRSLVVIASGGESETVLVVEVASRNIFP